MWGHHALRRGNAPVTAMAAWCRGAEQERRIAPIALRFADLRRPRARAAACSGSRSPGRDGQGPTLDAQTHCAGSSIRQALQQCLQGRGADDRGRRVLAGEMRTTPAPKDQQAHRALICQLATPLQGEQAQQAPS